MTMAQLGAVYALNIGERKAFRSRGHSIEIEYRKEGYIVRKDGAIIGLVTFAGLCDLSDAKII